MEDQEDIIAGTYGTSSAASDTPTNGTSAEEEDELHLMEQFMDNPAHDYHNFQHGDTVDGVIIRIDKDAMLVDIGTKAEGLVPLREMQSLSTEDREALHVGDEILVFVVQAEDRDGFPTLSIDRARQEKSWRLLQQAFEAGEIIAAHVINYNKGGLLVSLDGVRGFVPASQVASIGRGSDTQKQSDMARMVGESLELKIIEINRERNRLILSERQAYQEMREGRKDELLSALSIGDIYTGTVSSVCDFGAFVDIGGADGLVHLSELSWGRVKHPSELLNVGDNVQVCVLHVDNDRRRIALSMKRTRSEPWETISERYQLGTVVTGTITQLAAFGAFARIEDGVEGLIHISELGDGHVQHPGDVVQEGDSVDVRIIRIDPTRKRMGLSLRTQPEAPASPADITEDTEATTAGEEPLTDAESDSS